MTHDRQSFAIAPINGAANTVCRPVLEGLGPDPDHIGTELAPGIDEAERKRMIPRGAMAAEVAVATEPQAEPWECLASDATEVLQPLLVRLWVCVPLHAGHLSRLTSPLGCLAGSSSRADSIAEDIVP